MGCAPSSRKGCSLPSPCPPLLGVGSAALGDSSTCTYRQPCLAMKAPCLYVHFVSPAPSTPLWVSTNVASSSGQQKGSSTFSPATPLGLAPTLRFVTSRELSQAQARSFVQLCTVGAGHLLLSQGHEQRASGSGAAGAHTGCLSQAVA